MSKNLKIILCAIIIIIIATSVCAFTLTRNSTKKDDKKLNIVTTSFSSYDFVKHIAGDKANVTFLLGAGIDIHSYEPTASDLIKMQNADVFIYIGGEMEQWTDKVLESNTINTEHTTLIKISEAVNTIEEQEIDGAEEEHHHEDEKIKESDIKSRTLSEFDGKWKSLYPMLVNGDLDQYCEHKAEDDEDATKETYIEKYKKSWNCDVKNISIKDNEITFIYKDGKTISANYTSAGYTTKKDDDSNITSVRYQFQTDNTEAPKYVQFNDHNYEKSEEVEHFHIYFGNESFEKLMESETNPYFMPEELSKEEILKELIGHNHEHEEGAFDEHIWTSPENAIKMMEYLNTEIAKKDINNKEIYQANTDKYVKDIKNLQDEIKEIVNHKKRDRLVFGDKMPMQYFLNEYGLTASAAFSGCSTETEPSSKTIAYLVSKVKEEKIPVVLYIELSTGKTAKTIAEETGAKAMQIQTLHNVSKDDFNNGETYVTLMNRNLQVLKEALQ